MNEVQHAFAVWVVDDEAGMCMGVKRALQDHIVSFADLNERGSFTVSTMESGEAFLEKIRTEKPDILLLDGKLPGIDGIDVLEILSQQKSPIVTIMITAYATLENAIKATKLGAFDFLAKPFTPDELRYSIRKASRDLILTRRAQQLAQQKKEIRFEFISVLAHELKSPINAIEGFADMVKSTQDMPAEQLAQIMDRIGVRINGMRKLIADLLDLTSLESGRKKREITLCDLTEIVSKVVENNTAYSQSKEVSLKVEVFGACVLQADRSELEMLANNLVTNAIKYNKRGGRVMIRLQAKETIFELVVQDTGIGMSQKEQEQLFKEFSRIKNSQTRTIEGSGLGLTIIQKIVHLYNGRISVHSEPDVGSVFTVGIPFTQKSS
ncbi:MAG: response regulator [Chitinivibrionales bacterium]|nr:response regulator [Chitinivibrionales bacterium]